MTALDLVTQQGWSHRPSGVDQIAVEICPFCSNSKFKFYLAKETGLWHCMACDRGGNLYSLRGELGLVTDNVTSVKDAASSTVKPSPLPDLLGMHKRLLEDTKYGDVLEYLVGERQFSMAVIEGMKLGADEKDGKLWYVIPYFNATGQPIFYKRRTVPPAAKDFKAPAGREAPLYNEHVIVAEMEELCIVEGEGDCLSLLSQGYHTVVAVPGASVKKAAWIEKLDRLKPKAIYLVYDLDKPGQDNAKDIATRIGVDRVKNVVLPSFTKPDGSAGKDLNEWFCAGNTLEDFMELKAQAKPFDVQGVQSVTEILSQLRDDIEGRGTAPKYDTKWPSLTSKVGGFEDGDLIGVIAEGKVGKTTFCLNMLQDYAAKGYPGFMFCQEMPPKRMVRKWVSHVTQTDDTPGKSLITVAKVSESMEIARGMQADLLFGYTASPKPEDVYDTIRQAVRRYGVKVVCFDNLQMMVRSLEHSSQETSKYTKQFKAMAMELNVLMLLIVQPNRVMEGNIVAARNAMGSSAIEKDVDTMLCLHRNRTCSIKEKDFTGFIDTDETLEPHLMVKVDLNRYSSGGICTLLMDGATSTVREFTTQDVNPKTETAEAVSV